MHSYTEITTLYRFYSNFTEKKFRTISTLFKYLNNFLFELNGVPNITTHCKYINGDSLIYSKWELNVYLGKSPHHFITSCFYFFILDNMSGVFDQNKITVKQHWVSPIKTKYHWLDWLFLSLKTASQFWSLSYCKACIENKFHKLIHIETTVKF